MIHHNSSEWKWVTASSVSLLAVQQVDAVDVILAHLLGLAKDSVGVGNRHHGGIVVIFGESQSGRRNDTTGGEWSFGIELV